MRNQQTWDEANLYSNKLMVKLGIALIVLAVIFYLIPLSPLVGTVAGLVTVLVAVFIILSMTERRLKNLFDDDGQYKK